MAELDDKIFQATSHTHASYKGVYTVTLDYSPAVGFGMTLRSDGDGVTRVTSVARHGAASAAGVITNSEVVSVAGCALERGQGQDGLVPLTAVLGMSTVEFTFRRRVIFAPAVPLAEHMRRVGLTCKAVFRVQTVSKAEAYAMARLPRLRRTARGPGRRHGGVLLWPVNCNAPSTSTRRPSPGDRQCN